MKKAESPYHMQEFKKADLLEEKVRLFPFLRHITSSKDLQPIAQLIEKISMAKYEPNIKYNLLWDVIQLGALMEAHLPTTLTDKTTLELLDAIKPTSKLCTELTDQQQWCLFKIARNIVADGFHIIYEDKTKNFAEQVIHLCQGNVVKDALSEVCREVTKISRGSNVVKILQGNKEAQIKMFNQAGYFLERAKGFSARENPQAACLALVGAGNCCRFIMIGKISEGRKLDCVGELNAMRSDIVHMNARDITGESLREMASSRSRKTDETMVKLKNEAGSLGLESDVKAYVAKEKPTDNHESPRGYSK